MLSGFEYAGICLTVVVRLLLKWHISRFRPVELSKANPNTSGEFILEAQVMNATEKVRCQGNDSLHSFYFQFNFPGC